MLNLEFFQLSHPGLRRAHNEDSLGYFCPSTPEEARGRGWLFALADGVGGHERGEVASQIAVDAMVSGFAQLSLDEALTSAMPKLMQWANSKVYEAAVSETRGARGMATTMVACALRYDRALVTHAGDSRCYLVRQGYAAALTRDHTLPNEQLRMGLITPTEAGTSRSSHVLSRALGSNMFLSVDSGEHQLYAGDLLLLCSDGLHHSVGAEDIARLTHSNQELEQAAHTLVELANQRDGSDNVSVQVIRIRGVERVGMYRGRHYKLP